MTEFSLDWPHGWQTRDGKHKISRFMGTDSLGNVAFDTEENGVLVRYPGGYSVPGGTIMRDRDIINAPAPKPEPRKCWANMWFRSPGELGLTQHETREEADAKWSGDWKRIACVCITEGDGLEGDK